MRTFQVSWEAAEQTCQASEAHLVSVDSELENIMLAYLQLGITIPPPRTFLFYNHTTPTSEGDSNKSFQAQGFTQWAEGQHSLFIQNYLL